MGAVLDIASGRESADDQALIDAALTEIRDAIRHPTRQRTLDYLHRHLHLLALLHRNDTMGMAAGIEPRFPFLDNAVARFGVNLPGKCKLRRLSFVFETKHSFVGDKRVVGAVSDRYIPGKLCQRIKVGFWTTRFQRLEIAPGVVTGSPLADMLGLDRDQMSSTVAAADASGCLGAHHAG